jgi:hypothetical protein
VSDIPWWGLPLIAAAFTLLGAGAAQLVTIRNERGRKQADTTARWYDERKSAYVALLSSFERTVVRLRTGFAASVTDPDPLRYLDEVGPALMRVRLLASAPVRSAALAVHLLLEDMHGERPAQLPGREPDQHFLERLGHVPLVMHEFEVAVREELHITTVPPPVPPGSSAAPDWRHRARSLLAKVRQPTAEPLSGAGFSQRAEPGRTDSGRTGSGQDGAVGPELARPGGVSRTGALP